MLLQNQSHIISFKSRIKELNQEPKNKNMGGLNLKEKMASMLSAPNILKEKKFIFMVAFFLLLTFLTFLFISNSKSLFIPVATNLNQPDPVSYNLKIPPVPVDASLVRSGVALTPNSGISSNTESAFRTNISSNVFDDGDRVADVEWKVCDGSVAVDYIPCLDNAEAIWYYRSRGHLQHWERHCPDPPPRCLVSLPQGYKTPIPWPKSRDMIWYNNVPHPKLVEVKKDQHWVVRRGDHFIFPGGGTQFKNGADEYIDSIQKDLPDIELGKKTRVILDVGCGVASFGGAMLNRSVITMSFAPKDEHEAQIQFALEGGIPATLAVISSRRLTFPDNSFDLIHCARCRVSWEGDGGKPLLELNRLLRPGGYFIWSATPVYRKNRRDKNIWRAMTALTESMCWKMVSRTKLRFSKKKLAVYRKPVSSSCYQNRKMQSPPLCDQKSLPNSSWYVPLDGCLVPLPVDAQKWPSPWPQRLTDKPLSLPAEQDAEETFKADTQHWSALVSEVYIGGLGINWSNVRNVMDMNAGYGGFAAALINQPVWLMNVVPIDRPDTLSVIFDRGLIGIHHDWCECFSTYPRSYDLLHASFLLGTLIKRCDIIEIAAEMDRVLRPGGCLLVQDTMNILIKIGPILRSLHWSIKVYQGQFLVGKKGFWRPDKKTRI